MPGGKRPGTQSDEDRALAELQRRRVATPAGGVQIVPTDEFNQAQPTPPPIDPEELIAKLWPLRHAGDMLLEHESKIATLDERTKGLQKLSGGLAEIGETREEMREGFADIRGAKGDNGKLGELKRRVDLLSKLLWYAFTVFVTGVGTAIVYVVMAVRTFDATEARTEATAARQLELIDRVLRLETTALGNRFNGATSPDRSHLP